MDTRSDFHLRPVVRITTHSDSFRLMGLGLRA